MSQLCVAGDLTEVADVKSSRASACEHDAKIIEFPFEKVERAPTLTALSVEFVAVPLEAKRVRDVIPADIDQAFDGVEGYAGCMVMVSDQEARLVTVITLWSGADRAARCMENTKWVKRLLTPYVDRWLRTLTLATSLKGMQLFPFIERAENAHQSSDEDRP